MLEPIKVPTRQRRGGRVREGLDYTWTEHHVVSGRTVVSRHDTVELASKAADRLLADRLQRAQAVSGSAHENK